MSLLRPIYGLYAWLLLLVLGIIALPGLLLLRSLRARRALVRGLARAVLTLAGMRVRVSRLQSLPLPCIVVANHCSYLDGVVLAATLPPCFSFVIKREMSRVPLAGTLLRGIGAQFVERRDRAAGAMDTRRLLRQAAGGQAQVFFPEGTFGPQVGLLRFHLGAFVAAARSALPVVPVVIRGTRHCLPPDSVWPRPGVIEVEALSPVAVTSDGDPQQRALRLREAARAQLLAATGEPDLAGATPLAG